MGLRHKLRAFNLGLGFAGPQREPFNLAPSGVGLVPTDGVLRRFACVPLSSVCENSAQLALAIAKPGWVSGSQAALPWMKAPSFTKLVIFSLGEPFCSLGIFAFDAHF